LGYMDFPSEHWRGIHSTNIVERLNRELARRCDVVGIFPNPAAVLRLLGALLEEQQDDWLVQRRYFSQESMAKLVAGDGQARDVGATLASTTA
ncbi:MAG: transposase, partial [Armatimonadota bacterium]|nr:transposase [Armatimonadota bacterium]